MALTGISPQSLTFPNGYQTLPGGFMIQWGQISSISDTGQVFDFPTPFTTACLHLIINRTDGGGGTAVSSNANNLTNFSTATGFTFDRNDGFTDTVLFQYIAFGF
jgi:hypothetical protein